MHTIMSLHVLKKGLVKLTLSQVGSEIYKDIFIMLLACKPTI